MWGNAATPGKGSAERIARGGVYRVRCDADGDTGRGLPYACPLADARTGATFSLADLRGKTAYAEPMATWCTNCRQQMGVIRD